MWAAGKITAGEEYVEGRGRISLLLEAEGWGGEGHRSEK